MSGGSTRSIRNFSLELWQDLVLLDIRQSTSQHLTVNWNLNVLEMAFKTIHFVKGLSRTPLFFSSISHHQISQNDCANNKISRIENLKIQKPMFTNKCLVMFIPPFPHSPIPLHHHPIHHPPIPPSPPFSNPLPNRWGGWENKLNYK